MSDKPPSSVLPKLSSYMYQGKPKAGDVVRLATGGPKMTVYHVDNTTHTEAEVTCAWFERLGSDSTTGFPLWGDLKRDKFAISTLVSADDGPDGRPKPL